MIDYRRKTGDRKTGNRRKRGHQVVGARRFPDARDSGVEDGDQIRMEELAGCPHLAFEAFPHVGMSGVVPGQDLEGDITPQAR